MQIAVFTFNPHGYELAVKLQQKAPHQLLIHGPTYDREAGATFSVQVSAIWGQVDALLFFAAAGLVVRVISPLLRHKAVDPAVLVADALGQFVVSLLSGHLGGANQLTKQVAAILGATPVITTASDVLGKISVEEWASRQGLKIANPEGLVKINKSIVADASIKIFAENPSAVDGWPLLVPGKTIVADFRELPSHSGGGATMAVTAQPTRVADVDLDLKFPTLVVGIGCRRGTPRETIKRLLVTVFHEKQWSLAAVRKLVSVAQKKDEAGLIDLARELRVPLVCYSVRQLAAVLRDRPNIEQSAFVEEKIGVGAVCEPAAIWGSQGGKLLVEKRQSQGVTLAVARVALP